MNELSEAISNLKSILSDSDIYKNYLLAKRNLSNVELEMLKEYKQKKQNWNGGFEHEKFISHMYANLMLIENTRRFLSAEAELMCCMREIYKKIGEDFDIDVFA